jgi:hypothetical protein
MVTNWNPCSPKADIEVADSNIDPKVVDHVSLWEQARVHERPVDAPLSLDAPCRLSSLLTG